MKEFELKKQPDGSVVITLLGRGFRRLFGKYLTRANSKRPDQEHFITTLKALGSQLQEVNHEQE
jgi:hypothetical protein